MKGEIVAHADLSSLAKFLERVDWPVTRPCPEPDCTHLLPLKGNHRCPVHGSVRYGTAS